MPKSYYKQLMTIVLLLHECHGERIKVKELDSMAKDCFYSGLHEQYLDRTNMARKLRAMPPKLLNCLTKNSQNMLNHRKPLMWTKTLSMATIKELFRQQI